MKVFLKGVDHTRWVDLSQYVNMPFTIIDTKDGTGNTCKITFRFPSNLQYFDVKKALKPKMQIKITEVDNELLENENNTYLFLTGDNNSVRLRKDVGDELKGVYEHIVNGEEIISLLDSRFLPNYTITQPKSRYYSSYRKTAKYMFEFDYKFSQDGNMVVLPFPERDYYNYEQNNDIYTFGFDVLESKPYIEIDNVNDKSFNINISFEITKTAVGYFTYRNLITTKKQDIFVLLNDGSTDSIKSELNLIIQTIYYDDNNNELKNTIKSLKHYFSAGNIPYEQEAIPFKHGKIVGFPTAQRQSLNIDIEKIEDTKKIKVLFGFNIARKEQMFYRTDSSFDGHLISTQIAGLPDDSYVKTRLDNISIEVESSAYETIQEEKHLLLSEFVEKAIFDYNFNSRHDIWLTTRARTLLEVPAKEGEWVDYTLKELLERAFKYVNAIPILNIFNGIDFVKKEHSSIYIDLEQYQDKETQIIDIDYYDKVVSNTKNLVSEKDFVKERVIISSGDTEFSHITSDNASYLLSNDIYFTAKGILYTPPEFVIPIRETSSITHNIKGNILDGNGNIIDGMWDITKRLFEKDIYESLPDARNDSFEKRISPNNYTRGNTIYYESGSNKVGGLTHQAPSITGFDFVFEVENQAQYSIIEILTILALEVSGVATVYENPQWKFWDTDEEELLELKDLIDFELEITYVPYYKELTTKYISNMPERIGLNWEKKVNVNEKVISYSESADVLKREMEHKGNVIESFTEKYNSLSETIPTYNEINDNLVVTTKVMTVMNGFIDVDYTLQKNFILQNDDIRLPVAFERYNVPYEYVNRDIFIENHLIFRNTKTTRYMFEPAGCGIDFLNRIFLKQDTANQLEGLLYSKLRVNYDDRTQNLLMRMTKLEDRFSLVLTGKFLDNYTAGVQRYKEEDDGSNIYYSQPLSYVKWNGIVDDVERIQIGFNRSIETRLEEAIEGVGTQKYNFRVFPEGKNAILNTFIYNFDTKHLMRKDAREGIVLNHTSFLTTEEQDIKWYSFKAPNKVAVLNEDIELTDNLQFNDLDLSVQNHDFTMTVEKTHGIEYTINCLFDDDYEMLYNKGIVFLREVDTTGFDNKDFEIVGIIKNPVFFNSHMIEFFVYTTRYGKLEMLSSIQQWQGLFLEAFLDVDVEYDYNEIEPEIDQIAGEAIVGFDIEYTPIKVGNVYPELRCEYSFNELEIETDSLDEITDIELLLGTTFIELGVVENIVLVNSIINELDITVDNLNENIDVGAEISEELMLVANIENIISTTSIINEMYISPDSLNETLSLDLNMYDLLVELSKTYTNINVEYTINEIEVGIDSLNENIDIGINYSVGIAAVHSGNIETSIIVENIINEATIDIDSINDDIGIELNFAANRTLISGNDFDLNISLDSEYNESNVDVDSIGGNLDVSINYGGKKHKLFGVAETVINLEPVINEATVIVDSFNDNIGVITTVVGQDLPPPLAKPDIRSIETMYCEEITIEIFNNTGEAVDIYKDDVRVFYNLPNKSFAKITLSHSLNGVYVAIGGYFIADITFKSRESDRQSTTQINQYIDISCIRK